ncbi:hypothetical protein [Streptomyces sp. DH12]|uniref:hypothetical protein n=1 Tax=Streptomyces sp. DH12 TaxID=2857010 RepID=UPI001E390BB4|nr:hypothetical protein [Streptomyces sp. DH12]
MSADAGSVTKAGVRPAGPARAERPLGSRLAQWVSGGAVRVFLIVVGLFFVGGIISFVKQKMPTSLITLMSVGAALCIVTGLLQMEV